MKKMLKNKKKIIIAAAVGGGLILAVFLVLLFTRTIGAKPVDVYAVKDLTMDWLTEEAEELNGSVRAEGYQRIYLSETQTISDIFVSIGQDVRKGDALLAYDTTLTDLDIEKAGIAVQKKELDLQKAYKELAGINSLVPFSEVLIEPDNSWIHYKPVPDPVKMGEGKGTEEDPVFWLIPKDTLIYTHDFFKKIVPKGAEEVYNVLLFRDENAVNGVVEDAVGLHILAEYPDEEEDDPDGETATDGTDSTAGDSGSGKDKDADKKEEPVPAEPDYVFRFFDADVPDSIAKADIPEDPYYEEYGSEFTQDEINEMRLEQEQTIRSLEKQVKIAALEYEKKKTEISDNVVRATQDGKVKMVRGQETAAAEGSAVIEISAGGGYFVDVPIGELKLSSVQVGDAATVSVIETGVVAEGMVAKISTVPTEGASGGYSGNTNVSYYPATIAIPETAQVREGDFVTVAFTPVNMPGDSIYLPAMFIRQEKEQAYAYVKGKDGKLEKRKLKTGKMIYGSYLEIREGLTREDHIAFPYGKNLKPGAKTQEGAMDNLYAY